MPLSSIDSPRTPFGALSDVPEEPGSPNTTFSGSGSAVSTTTTAGGRAGSPSISISGGNTRPSAGPTSHPNHPNFRPQPSTSSLASLASASASVVSAQGSSSTTRPILGRNPSGLRGVSSSSLRADRDKAATSDTVSVAGASVSGVMASSSSVSKGKRSKSPGSATIREKDREGSSHGTDKAQGAVATRGGRPAPGMHAGGPRYRHNPHLPTGNADPVPATLMYWSKAPVYGHLPTHNVRAHSVTLVDGVAWIFGGCDEKGCFKDVWCFNTGALLPTIAVD